MLLSARLKIDRKVGLSRYTDLISCPLIRAFMFNNANIVPGRRKGEDMKGEQTHNENCESQWKVIRYKKLRGSVSSTMVARHLSRASGGV